ncbi:hypothetical protein [Arthrobacter woluwensis]|uniref:Uncharacterized protein n=1 Tax=Arthrobacter woluwensis TaxID=156980 RepID=A0A1H4R487_9MICC|nr:hypothetical protein [Arthrobacter woluwensis]SEC26683.1 hypothetical protein SAMN04489745_2460 [Arthrobacter woluwensis]
MDTAAKERVKEALKAQALSENKAVADDAAAEHSAAEVDTSSPIEPDDLSHSDEEGEFVELFQGVEAHQKELLAAIDALDVSVTETVRPGAIVAYGGDHYVVGVASSSFDCDGVSYEGIAPGSPVFDAIQGLREGDSFSFRGADHRLDLVV